MRDEQERTLSRKDDRAYEAPAVADLGAVDDFTQGDQSSINDS